MSGVPAGLIGAELEHHTAARRRNRPPPRTAMLSPHTSRLRKMLTEVPSPLGAAAMHNAPSVDSGETSTSVDPPRRLVDRQIVETGRR